jgi:hypothetical protein
VCQAGDNRLDTDHRGADVDEDEGRRAVGTAPEKWEVEDVDPHAPKRDDVMVKMTASGTCHSDWHLVTGDLITPFPVVGGHEGAGIVASTPAAAMWAKCACSERFRSTPWCRPHPWSRSAKALRWTRPRWSAAE